MRFAVIAAALAGTTNAWFGTGHLLVARIAENILSDKAPEQLEKARDVLKTLESTDASLTKNEKNHPFVECATFADSFKYNGGYYQKGWHFIDQPYLDEGGKISDYSFKPDTHNVTEAMNGLVDWFDGGKDNYVEDTVKSNTKGGDNDAVSIALRLVIHYVGDVHQPLHATSRVDHEYPKGDFGGNTVHLPSRDGVTNLHALWDSVAYEYSGYPNLPFSDSDWDQNGQRAADLIKKHPLSSLKADVTDLVPQHWADESLAAAEAFIYKGVKDGDAVPSDYVPQA
jgi:hypothetical protein